MRVFCRTLVVEPSDHFTHGASDEEGVARLTRAGSLNFQLRVHGSSPGEEHAPPGRPEPELRTLGNDLPDER